MDIKKAWIDAVRHQLPRFAEAVKARFGGNDDLGIELSVGEDAALQALKSWAADNPVDNLQRGRDPEKGIDYLRGMEEKDGHYSAMLDSRKMGLLSHPWVVVPVSERRRDQEAAEWINWNFQNIDGTMTEKIKSMLDSISIGFSIQEKVYEQVTEGRWAGKWRIKDIKDKDQKQVRFVTDRFGNLLEDGVRIRRNVGADLRLPPQKFLIYVFNKKRGSWYGNGVGVVCSWYSWFKRDGIKAWLLLLQKFGNPTVKGRVPDGAKPADRDQFKKIIESFAERTGITLPVGFEVELLEATRRGDAGYLSLLDYCDKQISKKLLGATLTAEPGRVGTYALGKVHAKIREDFIRFDAVSVQDAVNEQVIKPLVDYNFPKASGYPQFEFRFEEPLERKTLAEALKKAQEAGIEIPADWAYEQLRIPIPQEKETALVAVPKLKAEEGQKPSETKQAEDEATGVRWKRVSEGKKFTDTSVAGAQLEKQQKAGITACQQAVAALGEDIVAQVSRKLVAGGRLRRGSSESPIVVNVSGLRRAMAEQSIRAWLLGRLHATKELQRMGFLFPRDRLERSEFEEGLRESLGFFRERVPVTKAEYLEHLEEEKERYFTVAGKVKAEIESAVERLIDEAIRRGETLDDFKAALEGELAGWVGEDISEQGFRSRVAKQHLSSVLRAGLMRSYQAGRLEIYRDPEVSDFVPSAEYLIVGGV